MILSEIVAIRNKVTAAGGNVAEDLEVVLADNSMNAYLNAYTLIWDDANNILTMKKQGTSNFRNPATGRMEVRYSVEFIAYTSIQNLKYRVIKTVADAIV